MAVTEVAAVAVLGGGWAPEAWSDMEDSHKGSSSVTLDTRYTPHGFLFLPGPKHVVVKFVVKFFPPDHTQLREELTRLVLPAGHVHCPVWRWARSLLYVERQQTLTSNWPFLECLFDQCPRCLAVPPFSLPSAPTNIEETVSFLHLVSLQLIIE